MAVPTPGSTAPVLVIVSGFCVGVSATRCVTTLLIVPAINASPGYGKPRLAVSPLASLTNFAQPGSIPCSAIDLCGGISF
jgi:hypothetical protein